MRTVLLGLLGLAVAVTVGLGVHLVTRSTISLPVVRLEAPPVPATTAGTTTPARTSTEDEGVTVVPAGPPVSTEPETETEDSSGSGSDGSGHGRGRGRSGSGGGGEDD